MLPSYDFVQASEISCSPSSIVLTEKAGKADPRCGFAPTSRMVVVPSAQTSILMGSDSGLSLLLGVARPLNLVADRNVIFRPVDVLVT